MIPGKQYTPEDIVQIAWRRKWLVVAPFVSLAAAAAVVAWFLPNLYRSETLILVVPQRVPDSYIRSTITARIEDRLQSISPQILSRPRLERIINDFGLYAESRKVTLMEDVVDRMREQIEVQVVKGDAFRVSYVADDPTTAMRVAERLAALFIEENLRDRERQAEGTNQFLETQLEEARRTLTEQEARLEAYRRQHSYDMPGQLNSNLQAQHNAEIQVQSLVDSLSTERDRRLILQRQLSDLLAQEPEPVGADSKGSGPDATSAAAQLAAARTSLQAMEMRFTPQHPDVVRAKKLVAELEVRARGEGASRPAEGSGPVPVTAAAAAKAGRLADLKREIEKVDEQISSKEERERSLRASIVQYQTRIEAVPVRESELAELTRDYDTIQELYRSLLAKKEDSKIAANLERQQVGEQFKVIEPANLPEKPFTPNRQRISLLGAALGLALGLALAGLLEYLDSSMRSEADVMTALALPVLATIPLIRDESVTTKRRVRVAWGLTVAVTVALSLVGLMLKLRT